MPSFSQIRGELRPTFVLAWPVVTAELGWMTMGLVDTIIVGRVSAEALGAVSVGSHIFFAIAMFGIGMLFGLDYLVSYAHGAGRLDEARRWLGQGLWLAASLAVLLTGVMMLLRANLDRLGIQPEVAVAAGPYLGALLWSFLPLLLFATLRRYLQALGQVRPVMIALVSANLLNLAANWLLVFGNWGFPALGAAGSGWATTASRVYLFLYLLVFTLRFEQRAGRGARLPLALEPARVLRLARLGLPAALQLLLECGVFAVATVLAAGLAPIALAAHQVALSAASFTFMVPLGVSAAAAVRVGSALGRRKPVAAGLAGWSALLLGTGAMVVSALLFLVVPRPILRIFTTDLEVIAVGVGLLAVAALFQLFDGLQVVATGALRGAGDTRTPMLANLAGHWLLGLPIGAWLCYRAGWGIIGLWSGLCIGLIAVAIVLIAVWSRRAVALAAGGVPARSP